jgi:hypothetical protein
VVKEEVKRNPFAIDDFDAPPDYVDFSIEDNFSTDPVSPLISPPT